MNFYGIDTLVVRYDSMPKTNMKETHHTSIKPRQPIAPPKRRAAKPPTRKGLSVTATRNPKHDKMGVLCNLSQLLFSS